MDITFIGGGNMASALIAGLRKARADLNIRVADPSEDARQRLMREYGIDTFVRGSEAAPGSDVVVLAVKPQVMADAIEDLAPAIEDGQLVLSIAAGSTVSGLEKALGASTPIVRAMPNTPALIGRGFCGLYANAACRPHHREQAERIMQAGGEVLWVEDESLMDVVTAVSGSGPAYFFLLTEALAQAGAELGLSEQDALKLALHTAEGAGALQIHAGEPPAMLRKRVTSPGGTTQAAIEVLEAHGFRDLIRHAVSAATQRGRELGG